MFLAQVFKRPKVDLAQVSAYTNLATVCLKEKDSTQVKNICGRARYHLNYFHVFSLIITLSHIQSLIDLCISLWCM